VSFVVFFLELFGGFVQFDLGGLGGGDFLVELLLLASDFDGEFLDL
jgi:Flp pilus assembly protein protease CpaA